MRPMASAAACLAAACLAALAAPPAHGEAMESELVLVGEALDHAGHMDDAGHHEEHGEEARYEGEGFSFTYPASWTIHDSGVAEWDGWSVPVWGFGAGSRSADSRLYVAEAPPVIGGSEGWSDAVYLSRMAADEARSCESGEIAWGRYACGSYSVTHASHYHYTPWSGYYLVVYDWAREYADGSRLEMTSARVDVPTGEGALVMYAEAPADVWADLGIIDHVRSFAPSAAGGFPEPEMMAIAEGVYNYYDGYGSLVVVGEDGVLVMDPASAYRAEALKAAIAGVTDMPVRWVALTHEHYDHVGGTEAFGDAEVICQRSCAGIFELSEVLDVPDEVDVEFDEYLEIDVGGISVELHHIAPGDGEATTVAYLPEQRVLATADLYAPRTLTNAVIITDTNPLGLRKILNEVASWDVEHALNSHYTSTDPRDLREAAEFLNDLYDAVSSRMAEAYESGDPGAIFVVRADLPNTLELPEYSSWSNYADLPYHITRMADAIAHGA